MKREGVHSQGFIILQVDEIKDDVCIMDEENMSIVSFPRSACPREGVGREWHSKFE